MVTVRSASSLPRIRTSLLFALALALVFAGPSAAQQITGYWIDARSAHPEIGSGPGFGGSFSAPIARWLLVRIDVDTRAGSNERIGITCDDANGTPRGCLRSELITSTTHLDAFTIALMPFWKPRRWVRLAVGAGGGRRADAA